METKSIIIKNSEKPMIIRQYAIFEWRIDNEKRHDDYSSDVTLVRDNEVPYYEELIKLEKQYWNESKTVSLIPLFISAPLAFVFLTLLLIFKDNAELVKVVSWLPYIIFLIPATIAVVFTGAYGLYCSRKSLNMMNNEKNRDNIYLEKVKAIKDDRN